MGTNEETLSAGVLRWSSGREGDGAKVEVRLDHGRPGMGPPVGIGRCGPRWRPQRGGIAEPGLSSEDRQGTLVTGAG